MFLDNASQPQTSGGPEHELGHPDERRNDWLCTSIDTLALPQLRMVLLRFRRADWQPKKSFFLLSPIEWHAVQNSFQREVGWVFARKECFGDPRR
jgi:hypothetical protein